MTGRKPPAPMVVDDAAKDEIDQSLARSAAKLSATMQRVSDQRREAEYRRFRDEYEARRPRNSDDA